MNTHAALLTDEATLAFVPLMFQYVFTFDHGTTVNAGYSDVRAYCLVLGYGTADTFRLTLYISYTFDRLEQTDLVVSDYIQVI